jgi:UDP-N-acetylmuramate dehydrogenase
MKTEHNISLKPMNTFGFSYTARHLIRIYSENDLFEVMAENLKPLHILGGGSNILLTKDVDDYLLKNEIKGIEIIDEDDSSALVRVGSGENWHTFILWTLSHNLGGLENLSLIPGTVGAAPIQNIGAYGVEQKSAFHSLSAIHTETGVRTTFYNHQCKFGYRDSIFKNEVKGQYFITHVHYILAKKKHQLHLDYGDIKKKLEENNIKSPGIQDVADAVISIRQSKLPDPKNIGNAGSFFKNPTVPEKTFHHLKKTYEQIPSFPAQPVGYVKIPAAWLIEQSGYKGYTSGQVGVHKNQALVIVHYGEGSGSDALKLSQKIQKEVFNRFQIELEAEVNVW